LCTAARESGRERRGVLTATADRCVAKQALPVRVHGTPLRQSLDRFRMLVSARPADLRRGWEHRQDGTQGNVVEICSAGFGVRDGRRRQPDRHHDVLDGFVVCVTARDWAQLIYASIDFEHGLNLIQHSL
jgi:hypothetical protein